MTKRKWEKVGEGNYKVAYKKLEKDASGNSYVLQIPINGDELSAPKKVTRQWNAVNSDIPARALNGPLIYWNIETPPEDDNVLPHSIFLYCDELDKLKAIIKDKQGKVKREDLSHLSIAEEMVELINEEVAYFTSLKQEHQIRRALNVGYRAILAPFVEGTYEMSEREQAEALIKIYADSRQLIFDYDSKGNLIHNPTTGETRCVDFDEANGPRTRQTFFSRWVDATYPYETFRRNEIERFKTIKLGTKVNLLILYLEKHLKKYLFPRETLNKYITPEIIFALDEFEMKSIPLTIKTLEILFLLIHTYPQLSLSAPAIYALETNTSTFTAVEDICKELNKKLLELPKEKYLEFIEPSALTDFIREKQQALDASASTFGL